MVVRSEVIDFLNKNFMTKKAKHERSDVSEEKMTAERIKIIIKKPGISENYRQGGQLEYRMGYNRPDL